MDKKSNFINYLFIIGVIGVIIFCIISFNRKEEISLLLKKEDTLKVENSQTYNVVNKNSNSADKKVIATSGGVTKKTRVGKDFISSTTENLDDKNETINSKEATYDGDELELLARLINSEAGDEPYIGKVAVGNVVLYRSAENSKSIEEIIYARNQFDGINTKHFKSEPNEESKKAALEVLSGKKIVEEGYYFANLNLCSPDWAKDKTFICRIGDHWFFKKG